MCSLTFNCADIDFCINNVENTAYKENPFDMFAFLKQPTENENKLNFVSCIDTKAKLKVKDYFEGNIPVVILSNEIANKVYLSNKGSKKLTYSPASLSLFEQDTDSYFFFVDNLLEASFHRNAIIRFFINHLILANGLFFHSSGGIINNKSYLMTGFSDIGKSTALELMKPDKILSDDLIGSRLIDNKYHFYSTPFGRVVTENIHAEAKAVFFLIRSDKFRVEKLNKSQAVARYIAVHQKYILSLFGDIRVKAFQSARKFFSQIPAYELHFTKNYIDQDAISKILDGDESDVGCNPMSEFDWQFSTITRRKKPETATET